MNIPRGYSLTNTFREFATVLIPQENQWLLTYTKSFEKDSFVSLKFVLLLYYFEYKLKLYFNFIYSNGYLNNNGLLTVNYVGRNILAILGTYEIIRNIIFNKCNKIDELLRIIVDADSAVVQLHHTIDENRQCVEITDIDKFHELLKEIDLLYRDLKLNKNTMQLIGLYIIRPLDKNPNYFEYIIDYIANVSGVSVNEARKWIKSKLNPNRLNLIDYLPEFPSTKIVKTKLKKVSFTIY